MSDNVMEISCLWGLLAGREGVLLHDAAFRLRDSFDMQVPCCTPAGHCRFGTTPDGAFLCAGNCKGDAYVYETASGTLLKQVTPPKVSVHPHRCGGNGCR
jgi:hypothetical protein